MYNGKEVTNLERIDRIVSHIKLQDVKDNLSIGDDEKEDEPRINRLVEAAVSAAENYCSHYFALTELEFDIYNFSGSSKWFGISPLDMLVSVKTKNDGDVDWTDITADVGLEKGASYFELHFDESIEVDRMQLVVRVGYDVGKLPPDAEDAIIIKASDLFDTEKSSYTIKEKNQMVFETMLGSYYNYRFDVE